MKKKMTMEQQAAVKEAVAAWVKEDIDPHAAIHKIWRVLGEPHTATPSEDAIIEDITEEVGDAVDVAMGKHLSRSHTKMEDWNRVVYAVQAAATKELSHLFGVK